jgi:para-aminobenzoate synthetase component 1
VKIITGHGFGNFPIKFENPKICVSFDGKRLLKLEKDEKEDIDFEELSSLIRKWEGHIFGVIGYDFGEWLNGIKRKRRTFNHFPLLSLFFFDDFEPATDFCERPVVKFSGTIFYPKDEEFAFSIKKAIEKMEAGEMYVINLSRVLKIKSVRCSSWLDFYLALQRHHTADFSFYMEIGDKVVICNSPELFLKKEGDTIFSEPIKGTLSTSVENGEEFLRNNPKERAENIMIVDMMRNDLNRICVPGSVHVPALFSVKKLPSVYQMFSIVSGKLVSGIDFMEIMIRTFPPASVTGAPKIQVMKNISLLEPFKRGIYCGSAFLLKPNKNFVANVIIRVLVVEGGDGFYYTGAGITVDSNPFDEVEETKTKCLNIIPFLNEKLA